MPRTPSPAELPDAAASSPAAVGTAGATIDQYIASAQTVAQALAALATETCHGILCGDQRICWQDVIQQALARAQWFATQACGAYGCAPNRPPHVGLLLANGPEFVYWLAAAALSPVVVVGLNDTRSPAALAQDVQRADCAIVLYDASHRDLASQLSHGASTPVVSTDVFAQLPVLSGPADVAAAAARVGVDDLLALIFTSGTSGDPKAVRVTHRKITAPAQMLVDRFRLSSADCFYNAMPMFHSNALLVAVPLAILTGGNLALRERFSASGWLGDVRRFRATFANYVGAPLTYIAATAPRADDANNPLRIVYGNEAPPDVRETFARRFGVRVVDGFGSTEGGVAISRTPETPPAALGPLPASALVVHPQTDQPCAPAVFSPDGQLLNADEAIGELVGRGPGLFAGYYNTPEADAEKMRGGLFRTGDLVYTDAAGFVYFAGRAATWMRVGGENLAAAPIERVLARHRDIAEVAVYGVASPDAPGDEVAAAVVLVGTTTAETFAAGLRAFLAAQPELSARQWPRYVRVTRELPRTASYKIVVRDLAARGSDRDGAGGDVVLERRGRAPADYSAHSEP